MGTVGEYLKDWGSPPRVRGKVKKAGYDISVQRITPACAGKRVCATWFRVPHQDHPRVCGEKCVFTLSAGELEGSPPRVRGKAPVSRVVTYPGKDHPRVCGEKNCIPCRQELRVGSPPRVRGKAVEPGISVDAYRITPACAGKSSVSRLNGWSFKDHPRVCGEKGHKCTHFC